MNMPIDMPMQGSRSHPVMAACLSPGQARQLGELSLEAEARLGRPVEAEVLLAAGQMYLAWCHRQGLGEVSASGARPAREPG